MKEIINSINKCLKCENYTAALLISLSIPDICGRLENKPISSTRYINWFNKYMYSKYNNFLNGNDCYALRCSILHEGSQEITKQPKREILDKFYFTTNEGGHLSRFSGCIVGDINYDNKEFLQVSVLRFCEDFIAATEEWEKDVENKVDVQENIRLMFVIHKPTDQLGAISFG